MDLPTPPDPFQALLMGGRLPALLVGIVLLGWGERLYRVLVVAPGVLAGVYLAAWLRGLFHLDTTGAIIATLVLAGAGALACHFVEGVAVRSAGAGLFAALAWLGTPLVHAGPVPWWAPVVAAVLGGVVFPMLYRVALRPLTALVGAWSVAWAVQRPDQVWLIGGLALAGTALQFALARTGGGDASEPKKKPKKKK